MRFESARSTDIAGRGDPGLVRRWGMRVGPWLWATRLRILFVIDGRIDLSSGASSFGLGPVLQTLRDPTFAWWVRFEVDVARRAPGDPTENPSPAEDEERYLNFRFTQPGFSLDAYDQVWLFGDFPGPSGPSPDDSDIEEDDSTPLHDAELRLLAEWMDRGGGVFATGDHEYLGASMCYRVPRVRRMRKWTFEQGVPLQYGGSRHDTMQGRQGQDQVAMNNEMDSIPQPIEPVYRATATSATVRTLIPHPLLCGPEGVIELFPDHMHEGEVIDDDQVELNDPLDIPGYAGVEFPGVPKVRPRPEVVAYGRTTDQAPHPEPVDAKRYGLVSAYEGSRVGIGRVVVDSTWHHWFSLNLDGFAVNNRPVYDGMQAYYRNVALWLATPDQRASMLAAATWGVIVADPMDFPVELRTRLWEVGEKALDAIGRTASQCTIFGLAESEWPPVVLERAFVPPETPASAPCTSCLPIDLLLRAVVGGIGVGLLELAHDYNAQLIRGRRPRLDPEAIAAGAAEGIERGNRELVEVIRGMGPKEARTADTLERPYRPRESRSIPVPVEVLPLRVVAERLQFTDPGDPAVVDSPVTLTIRVGPPRSVIALDVVHAPAAAFESGGRFLELDRLVCETTAQSGEPLVVEVLAGAWGVGDANTEALRYRDTLVGDPSDWLGRHLPSSDQRWRLWYRVESADRSAESEPSHDG
jgi:hypothetical protein